MLLFISRADIRGGEDKRNSPKGKQMDMTKFTQTFTHHVPTRLSTGEC